MFCVKIYVLHKLRKYNCKKIWSFRESAVNVNNYKYKYVIKFIELRLLINSNFKKELKMIVQFLAKIEQLHEKYFYPTIIKGFEKVRFYLALVLTLTGQRY